MTTVTHSNLTTHSGTFALTGAVVTAAILGNVADGKDQPELQQMVGGNWMQLDPPIRFSKLEIGGVKASKLRSDATNYRWYVPTGHAISTSVTSGT